MAVFTITEKGKIDALAKKGDVNGIVEFCAKTNSMDTLRHGADLLIAGDWMAAARLADKRPAEIGEHIVKELVSRRRNAADVILASIGRNETLAPLCVAELEKLGSAGGLAVMARQFKEGQTEVSLGAKLAMDSLARSKDWSSLSELARVAEEKSQLLQQYRHDMLWDYMENQNYARKLIADNVTKADVDALYAEGRKNVGTVACMYMFGSEQVAAHAWELMVRDKKENLMGYVIEWAPFEKAKAAVDWFLKEMDWNKVFHFMIEREHYNISFDGQKGDVSDYLISKIKEAGRWDLVKPFYPDRGPDGPTAVHRKLWHVGREHYVERANAAENMELPAEQRAAAKKEMDEFV